MFPTTNRGSGSQRRIIYCGWGSLLLGHATLTAVHAVVVATAALHRPAPLMCFALDSTASTAPSCVTGRCGMRQPWVGSRGKGRSITSQVLRLRRSGRRGGGCCSEDDGDDSQNAVCRTCRRALVRPIPCPEAGQTSSSGESSLER